MMHQKIRPHTKMPTTSAAITAAIQRSYILWAWRLMPLLGHPKLPNLLPKLSIEQPESTISNVAPPIPSPAMRTATLGRAAAFFAPTCSCLLSSAAHPKRLSPPEKERGRQGVTDGRTLLDQAVPICSGGRISTRKARAPTTGRYRSQGEFFGRSGGVPRRGYGRTVASGRA